MKTEALLPAMLYKVDAYWQAANSLAVKQLYLYDKLNMVMAALSREVQNTTGKVADATVDALVRVVPANVPRIMFLSGGHPAKLASSRLGAMHASRGPPTMPGERALPWPLSFSVARALQRPALDPWAGKDTNGPVAQQAQLDRARCNCAALNGECGAAMEVQ